MHIIFFSCAADQFTLSQTTTMTYQSSKDLLNTGQLRADRHQAFGEILYSRILKTVTRLSGTRVGKLHVSTHRIHVWYIHLHLVDLYGKCRWIYHTWILWGTMSTSKNIASLQNILQTSHPRNNASWYHSKTKQSVLLNGSSHLFFQLSSYFHTKFPNQWLNYLQEHHPLFNLSTRWVFSAMFNLDEPRTGALKKPHRFPYKEFQRQNIAKPWQTSFGSLSHFKGASNMHKLSYHVFFLFSENIKRVNMSKKIDISWRCWLYLYFNDFCFSNSWWFNMVGGFNPF